MIVWDNPPIVLFIAPKVALSDRMSGNLDYGTESPRRRRSRVETLLRSACADLELRVVAGVPRSGVRMTQHSRC
jgi:hypothetical protein